MDWTIVGIIGLIAAVFAIIDYLLHWGVFSWTGRRISSIFRRHEIDQGVFKDWKISRGPWTSDGKSLMIDCPHVLGDAYYIWNSKGFSSQMAISFRLKFLKRYPIDFRIAIFASRLGEGYNKASKHLMFLAPWEGGDYRIDGINKEKGIEQFLPQIKDMAPVLIDKEYKYDLIISSNNVQLKIDDKIILEKTTEELKNYFVEPFYWGFSSVGGSLGVSGLEILYALSIQETDYLINNIDKESAKQVANDFPNKHGFTAARWCLKENLFRYKDEKGYRLCRYVDIYGSNCLPKFGDMFLMVKQN
ncbi:MAG: hypothetical protein A2231_11370 [Candidatus Firestonebacteria bacterium RIFOXYA2_FULL_40_8]|nr:MAG: hypothetical protein A2231_11370 [Candidatus Firestonebacteria bacterium RIFOXYA2_FULL_40_8]